MMYQQHRNWGQQQQKNSTHPNKTMATGRKEEYNTLMHDGCSMSSGVLSRWKKKKIDESSRRPAQENERRKILNEHFPPSRKIMSLTRKRIRIFFFHLNFLQIFPFIVCWCCFHWLADALHLKIGEVTPNQPDNNTPTCCRGNYL